MRPAPRALYLDGGAEPVFAILHEPTGAAARDTAALICPPYGWEEVCSYRSRRWWAEQLAADGYATLRLSFPSTGDSGGSPRDPARLDAWTSAVAAAASRLRGAAGANRLVAIGLGLGGMVAYRAAASGAEIDELALWATPARGKVAGPRAARILRAGGIALLRGTGPPAVPAGTG